MNWDDLVAIHTAIPEPKAIFYRLYHDENGFPLFYSMEDLSGTYIEISQEQYSQNKSNVRVINGKLVEYQWRTFSKLKPTDSGTACHINDVSVVVSELHEHQKWSKQTYEAG